MPQYQKTAFYSLYRDTYFTELLKDTDAFHLSILNFNYTPLLNSELQSRTRNIHGYAFSDKLTLGSYKSQLIFGIDSTHVSASEAYYKFTKISRSMLSGSQEPTKSVLTHDINTVAFVGHSLNKADYAYFQSIFDYLSIYDMPINLVFYYTSFHENHPEKMIAYQNAIELLMETYGKTLDNKDHGDNFLAKLILENRLSWQITSLIRTSPESFNGSLLMMYF